MDRYCEFCVNLRSVVYCKSDAAYLCLSCDTKVHSANPLSNRHYRTLICELCKRRPTYVRCYDHHKFMCRGCDVSQHAASCPHQKRFIRSYVGCPSARDLGALWGFDLNQFDGGYNFGSSCDSGNTSVVELGIGGSGSIDEDVKNQNTSPVFRQLVDLLRAQVSEDEPITSIMRYHEQKAENDGDRKFQKSVLDGVHPHHHDFSQDACSLSFAFAQLDNLASPKTDESTLQGDFIWQCKSPVQSNQLWYQNMQDLGVCEEATCLDDLNIPDIDLTFRNFEELFRTDQEPTSVGSETTTQDTSTTTFVGIVEPSQKKACYASSIMSFTHSRFYGQSSNTEYIDSGIIPSCISPDRSKSTKSKETKDPKPVQPDYKKARSNTRKRVKSQSWKSEIVESI